MKKNIICNKRGKIEIQNQTALEKYLKNRIVSADCIKYNRIYFKKTIQDQYENVDFDNEAASEDIIKNINAAAKITLKS